MPKAANSAPKAAAKAPARISKKDPLTREQLNDIDAWWRATNYLSACQLYLLDNPLLRQPLRPEHLKQNIVGHCTPAIAQPAATNRCAFSGTMMASSVNSSVS
mgnify:CR=1 FL=1